MQVELGFGNIAVDDVFFVPGYDIRGFVVAQVKYYIFYFLSYCLFIYFKNKPICMQGQDGLILNVTFFLKYLFVFHGY